MYSQTKIAVPIFKKDKKSIIEEAQYCIQKGADLIEFRIDGMDNPKPQIVREIIEEINFPTIATNRVKTEGGLFKGTEEQRVNILLETVDVAEFVDIELQTNDNLIKQITETNVKTIISYHDFKKTPPLNELLNIVFKEKNLGNIAKVALMPNDLEDTLTVLAILSHCEDTIAISMGDIGSYTRVISTKFNAPITFAVSSDVTAPGQIDIETMKQLLNLDIMDIDDLNSSY
ncbi:MAG: type I 3-dehydroquinate dehydratase [Methanobacteriaceae archaeon]|jgi:3-dehydroquinate dehydratase-1|uniref:type I 3-dehydroquinate dehydratase n=1 Tax=Methanobrevibacter TaxID=2172 RepID=UPI002A122ABF|nr:type I 3-dehydroquinate dehydratase [Methanobacteriaceae archaeon]MDD3408380.1 type I 3-dehydroquinate dehydratase [Methanobacteriaceae archaeon]MDD4593788.1 type I 3-dehydroquinate dehydratase [Methanobacteriaceae archaeon]